MRWHSLWAESAETSLSSVASCQELGQTAEVSSIVRGGQAAVEFPPTLQIIDKQWDPNCCEPSTHWNCACFMQSRAGKESSTETTNIWEMVRSGFACLSRTLPLQSQLGRGETLIPHGWRAPKPAQHVAESGTRSADSCGFVAANRLRTTQHHQRLCHFAGLLRDDWIP